MINYVKRKISKFKARRFFREYEGELKTFSLPEFGEVQYFQWLNPLEKPKIITKEKVDFFRKFITPGSFAIDIGAHTGDTTLPMGLAAGPSGKILALDPNPYIFKLLEKNCRLNTGKLNIEAINCAATVTDGDFFYYSSEASFNNGAISEKPTTKSGNFQISQKVKGINLLNYLNKNLPEWLPKLSLIKVDTEGYDKEVLNSLSTLISEYKPAVIMECFFKLTLDERRELFDSVAKHGYRIYHFDDFGASTEPILIQQPAEMMQWKHFDMYCIPLARKSV